MAKVYEKREVILLRRRGHTYKEIMKLIPNVAKGTISIWCNSHRFTPDEIKKINDRSQIGRDKARLAAAKTNHALRLERDKIILDEATKLFEKYKNEPLFILGVSLYWGEGTKTQRHFQFTNSDPEMISAMMNWLEKYLNTPREIIRPRLYMHLHKNNTISEYEHFWSKYLKIPISNFHRTVIKKTNYHFNKKKGYSGCIRIEAAGGVKSWLTVMAWRKLLVENVKI
ncbi:MAG TPA: hypothetical protein VI432_02320 [Candidatus Paceibacterota bacterium]